MKLALTALLGLVHVGACAGARRQTHVTTYPDHTVRWQVETTDGVPDGLSHTWHENGRLASRGIYRHGVREGVWLYWDPSGREVARDTYRDGRLVAGAEVDGVAARAQSAPVTESATAPPGLSTSDPDATEPDVYTVLTAGLGVGQTNSTSRADSDSSEAVPLVALALQLRHRDEMWIYGGSADLSGELFGASHYHLGGIVGLASPGERAHLELVGEGGVHLVSGLGKDLFTDSRGGSATLPYVGGQLRLDLDPGAPGHLRIDVAVAGRADLGRTERQVMTTTCFFGCSDAIETWNVGGQTLDVTLGLTYQFK